MAYGHAHHGITVGVVDVGKALLHLTLGEEGLDDTESAQGLVELCQQGTPVVLCLLGFALELATDGSHGPCQCGHSYDDEEGELPAEEEEAREGDHDGDGVLDEHLQRVGERGFESAHVATHTRNDISLALLGEETQGQSHYLIIYLYAYVAYHACAQGDECSRRAKVTCRLQQCHHDEHHTRSDEHPQSTARLDEVVHVVVEVVLHHVGYIAIGPCHVFIGVVAHLEEDLQDGDEQGE